MDESRHTCTELKVIDNGIGFPDNLSFTTIETSGMAIVGSIVERLHGTISLESDEGACISLWIPNRTNNARRT